MLAVQFGMSFTNYDQEKSNQMQTPSILKGLTFETRQNSNFIGSYLGRVCENKCSKRIMSGTLE